MLEKAIYDDLKKAYVSYYKKNCKGNDPPRENVRIALEMLDKLKAYLDQYKFKMPPPLYKYNEKDIKTWMFLEGKYSFHAKTKTWKCRDVYNPNFKYGLL